MVDDRCRDGSRTPIVLIGKEWTAVFCPGAMVPMRKQNYTTTQHPHRACGKKRAATTMPGTLYTDQNSRQTWVALLASAEKTGQEY